MTIQYEPKDHIQRLDIAPRAEGVLDQREITIQSYQTTVPFDIDAINIGLERAWLTPAIRFGVFSCTGKAINDCGAAVLGLQDELSVRAYDYDNRRPLWYSWQDIIVDTVSVRYFKDDDGMLRFTTMGGGRRITEDLLEDFNSTFLGIPKKAVSKRHFDLVKLRELCFSRFIDHLYMVRFSDPSGEEYRSIDHALFQSRDYIDPKAGRLQEVRADSKVKIESFDSDISIRSEALVEPPQVRFFIRGLSGSLRLRFPKLIYKSQFANPEQQARVFYNIVNATVDSILDADYYAGHLHSLDDLKTDLGMFPDIVELEKFRDVLVNAENRKQFFSNLDLGVPWNKWQPHLYAIDELLPSDNVYEDVKTLITDLSKRDSLLATRLLAKCQEDAKMYRVGCIVAEVVAKQLQSFPADVRPHIEVALLAWAIQHEADSWDVDMESGEIQALNLRWKMSDLSVDIQSPVLWKLVGVIHSRLVAANGNTGSLLQQFNWCMTAVKSLPSNLSKLPPAFRLVVDKKTPTSIADGAKILKEPVADLVALDDAVLNQFGLPLWPYLSASRKNRRVVLENTGVGIAIAVKVTSTETLFSKQEIPAECNLLPNQSIPLPNTGKKKTLDVHFSKFGREYHVKLPIEKTHVISESKKTKASARTNQNNTTQRKIKADTPIKTWDKGKACFVHNQGKIEFYYKEEIKEIPFREGSQTPLVLLGFTTGTQTGKEIQEKTGSKSEPSQIIKNINGTINRHLRKIGHEEIQDIAFIQYSEEHSTYDLIPKIVEKRKIDTLL